MTAYAEVADAVAALKEGAYDYLTKPFEIDELLLQLQRIGQHRSLRRELDRARAELADRRRLHHPHRTLAQHAAGDRASSRWSPRATRRC